MIAESAAFRRRAPTAAQPSRAVRRGGERWLRARSRPRRRRGSAITSEQLNQGLDATDVAQAGTAGAAGITGNALVGTPKAQGSVLTGAGQMMASRMTV